MANCAKCGKGKIKKNKKGFFKCRFCGPLPRTEKVFWELTEKAKHE